MQLRTFSGQHASQNPRELKQMLALFSAEGIGSYAEIGAREGDTFHAVVCSLPIGSLAVAVDLPGSRWGKQKTAGKLDRAVADLVKRGYRASALFGDSRATATIRLLQGRGPFDAILIDGDHSLAGVTADWMAYRSSARKLVCFHDIAGTGERDALGPVEVPLLWSSIRANGHRTAEFIAKGSVMGIGVVWN
jgi:hypothetical protein